MPNVERMRRGLVTLCVVVVSLSAAFLPHAVANWLICGKCGHENDEDSRFCSHCGGSLADAQEVTTEGADKPPLEVEPEIDEPEPGVSIEGPVIEAELEEASKFLQKHNGWLAKLFCENAMALNMLADDGETRSEKILKMLLNCDRAVRRTGKTCPDCGGTGRLGRKMDSVTTSGATVEMALPDASCSMCGGTGRMVGANALSVIKEQRNAAIKDYTILRTSRRWVSVGRAWIPPEYDRKLGVRQTCILKRTTGAMCEDCLGLGRSGCTGCNGTGAVKCGEEGCENGMIVKQAAGLGGNGDQAWRKEHVMRSKCPRCGGRGLEPCPDCRGRGSVACETCGGTGMRAVCRKCDGQGFTACRKCAGSGRYRDKECASCRGEGVATCSTCLGDGRSKDKKRN